MRSNNSKEEFFLQMKKKPHIQELHDKMKELTKEEIQNWPNTQQWIKDCIFTLRENGNLSIERHIQKNIKDEVVNQHLLDNKFKCRQFTQNFKNFPTGRRMGIDVSEGDLILIVNSEKGLYYFDYVYGYVGKYFMNKVINELTEEYDYFNINEYKTEMNNIRLEIDPNPPKTNIQSPNGILTESVDTSVQTQRGTKIPVDHNGKPLFTIGR